MKGRKRMSRKKSKIYLFLSVKADFKKYFYLFKWLLVLVEPLEFRLGHQFDVPFYHQFQFGFLTDIAVSLSQLWSRVNV